MTQTIHCTSREMHLFLDRELPPGAAESVSAHIVACPSCASRFRALRSFDAAVRSLPLAAAPPGLTAHVMSALDPFVRASRPFRLFTWLSLQAGFLVLLFVVLGVCAAAGFIALPGASTGMIGRGVFAMLDGALAACTGLVSAWLAEPGRTGTLLITFSATLVLFLLALIDRNLGRKLTHR